MASAAPEQWSGRLAITGMGLVTPVGLTAPATCAALRAGVSRLSAIEGFTIQVGKDDYDNATGARVPRLAEGLLGPARLQNLMRPALHEALEDAGIEDQRLGVFLGTCGSNPAARVHNYDKAMRDNLLASMPEGAKLERAKLIQSGRASVQKSLRKAALALEQDLVDAVVIGAADSWVTPRALNYLRREGRLPEYPRHTGTIPAEAAGFLVLETPQAAAQRSARVYAEVIASAGSVEAASWGEASNAAALAQAVQSVVGDTQQDHAVIISDLDGERYRAMEWVLAEAKGVWSYSTMDHWNPADCVGDSGAAMGAITLALGSMALHRGYAHVPRVLLWGASDEGAREAVMLESAGGAG